MTNKIHMLKSVTDDICNSFIITTEDDKIIVIDGGQYSEAEYFLSCLREVTGTDRPHIDAWFLSHPHGDHVETFYDMIEHHSDEVSLDRVYLNFPSQGFFAGKDDDAERCIETFYRLLPQFADKIRILTGGDTLNIGAAYFKVLYSHDFEFPNCNNSSLVFRMELGGKSVLFLGDCEPEAGDKILRLWKDSGLLDCDICQMAHHGQGGCKRDFYEAVRPSVCLWCTPSWLWTNCGGDGPFQTLIVRGWMEELEVKTHYVMMDGTQVIALS